MFCARMIYFIVPQDQAFGLAEYLDMWGPGLLARFRIIVCEELPTRSSLEPGTYVLSSLDQLTPAGLRLIREVEAELRSGGPDVRVLNSAHTTLFRLELLNNLSLLGLNQHRAIRASDDASSLNYPVFIREEHQHTGALTGLLHNRRELEAALTRCLLLGHRREESLIMEFCDTADSKGYYRMYSALAIGQEVVPQFMNITRDWLAKHSNSEFTSELLLEEQAYVRDNPHQQELRRLFALAGVQYGRIDYGVKDGKIETWEINLNPTLARYPALAPDLLTIRDRTVAIFHEGFCAAFEKVDPAWNSPALLPLQWHAKLRYRGAGDIVRKPQRYRIPPVLLRKLRPVAPLILWLVNTLSPLLARQFRLPR